MNINDIRQISPKVEQTRVIVINLAGEREYVRLPSAQWAGRKETRSGVTTEALYHGRRTGRMFVREHSIHQKRGWNAHGVVGTVFRELDHSEYLERCHAVGCEPVAKASEV